MLPENKEARNRANGPSLESKENRPQSFKPRGDLKQVFWDAEDRAEDLLSLWRWREELSYRLRLARLRFEAVGLAAEEQAALENEIGEFRAVVDMIGGGA